MGSPWVPWVRWTVSFPCSARSRQKGGVRKARYFFVWGKFEKMLQPAPKSIVLWGCWKRKPTIVTAGGSTTQLISDWRLFTEFFQVLEITKYSWFHQTQVTDNQHKPTNKRPTSTATPHLDFSINHQEMASSTVVLHAALKSSLRCCSVKVFRWRKMGRWEQIEIP